MTVTEEQGPAKSRDVDVVVVGAGPTGLTLALSLTQAGIKTVVIDRLASGQNTSRAAVVHARTLEVLEPLGVSKALVEKGVQAQRFTIRDRDRVLVPIGFGHLPTQYPYALMVSQATTEAALLEQYLALGGEIVRPAAVCAVHQDAQGVAVVLEDGRRFRGQYLVGADGMHSVVREQVGIPFTGNSYPELFVLADAELEGGVPDKEVVLYFSPAGMVVVAPLPGGQHRIVATTDVAPSEPDAQWLQGLLDARGPQKERVTVRRVIWGSRFHVHHRIAESYRAGRVLLAGDAAHVHSPAGGQGMNAGIIDGATLAAALVKALKGDLQALDHYGDVRRPIAQKIVHLADRLTRLASVKPGWRALRNAIMWLVGSLRPVRERLAWQLSGLTHR